MGELPTGTVTFLFTDIEGSTRLLQRLGADYDAALDKHRRLLRAAFISCRGVEIDTQGDAFFVAFQSAAAAVEAAVRAQRALGEQEWPEQAELRVRMGIHTGEPRVASEGYVGEDVHTGARICAAAHGGQVLLSEATAHLVPKELDGVSLRFLGEHRLKDIEDPVILHQLVIEGLRNDYPPLRTPSASHPTNLPPRLPSLIGRDEELSTLQQLLASPNVSVVTLVGPGGTGKTRLALATGAELLSSFPDGVFFVDLSALTDSSLVVPTIARALSLRETPGRSMRDALIDHLADKETMLILDNLEQVIDAAPDIAALLIGAPALKLLATSREPLRIAGEKELPIAPLSLPKPSDPPEDIAASPAVRLFVARARDVHPGFALIPDDASAVAEICRRLDGLPLAIELAAARAKVLSLPALAKRLELGLKVLTSGRRDASARQRTLRGAIAWSYDLLTEDEQTLFRRLGVFAGGWSLEAAEAVCDQGDLDLDVLDGLASLVNKSLVRTDEHRERFSMLETIREFAAERLEESGEAEDKGWAHAEFFRATAEKAEPHLVGPDQKQWLDRMELERANFHAALESSIARRSETAIQLGAALWRLWRIRGTINEGRRWLQEAVVAEGSPTPHLARALRALSILCDIAGDYGQASRSAQQAAELYADLGDTGGVADSLAVLAGLAQEAGDLKEARTQFDRVKHMYAALEDARGVAVALGSLANIALLEQHYDEALRLASESRQRYAGGGDREGSIHALITEGFAQQGRGSVDAATEAFRAAHLLATELDHREGVAVSVEGLAAVAVSCDLVEQAARLLGKADLLRREAGLARQALEEHFYRATLAELRDRGIPEGIERWIAEGESMDVAALTDAVERHVSQQRAGKRITP
jgi:predicted ATPase/class 3 adenylate cyclase